MSFLSNRLQSTAGKAGVAVLTFAIVVGGWLWVGPLVMRQLPLPDRVARGGADRCAIWFVGSSTIERWQSMQRDVPGWRTHNRGVGGALLDQIDARLGRSAAAPAPAAIVAYAGENDIAAGESGEEAALAMLRLVVAASARWPGTPFFVVGLKPSPSRWSQRAEQLRYNSVVAGFATQRPRLTYLPAGAPLLRGGTPDPSLFVDGVHLNDRGYSLWSHDIRRGIDATMPPPLVARCARPPA